MSGSSKDVDLIPIDLHFSILSSKEIRKLSVVEIVTALTFDQLGRPFPGGLYDPLLGTYGKETDPCGTCLSMLFCPGHIGHIDLHALVYNPFFIRNIYTILSISCLTCHKLQISSHIQAILELQLKLVDNGYFVEAQEIEIFKSTYICESGDEPMVKREDGNSVHPKLAEMYELLRKGVNNSCGKTKTTNGIRHSIVNASLLKPVSKKCIHCKSVLKKVLFSYKKLLLSTATENSTKKKGKTNKVILADECRNYLRTIYDNHKEFLPELFPIFKLTNLIECPVDIFFMDCIAVTPPKARPSNVLLNQIVEHPQTNVYRNIIETNSVLKSVFRHIKSPNEKFSEESLKVFEHAKGETGLEKMYFAWQDLQAAIDLLLDENIKGSVRAEGLKQILEKKEGLIRKHMMGKRVNFAARTVITPDPNIDVDEVGIPDVFARKLSYPVPVSSWNIMELRKMVMNGPDIYPGANYIENSNGYKTLIPANQPDKRESLAKLLLTNPENGIKLVHRHILNGDILLLNRQPTLHRPGIMAHKARILQGEKTFRLHYSNCKSYNADFDGDEMNAHLPQNELARSEAYTLANVANQYLVPKDGTPLGGLIQDQVISGVKLSVRGRFFNKDDYQQLVFQGLSNMKGNIKLLPPAIIKPKMLWSGKQVLSTIIINLTPDGYPPITLSSFAKIGTKNWMVNPKYDWIHGGTQLNDFKMSETEVIIREGELVSGVLDKQQYGATQYGLIHCVYELYGGNCSTRLLTSFTKVFTYFLQREGFTLGVHDILVTPEADKKRRQIIKDSRAIGNAVVASALDMNEVPEQDIIAEKLSEAYKNDPVFRTILDRKYKTVLDGFTNDINKTCIPDGLICKFPSNNLQLMVLSGAKGSMVNTMQISSLLGQIELEGKRPPLMMSGKSLPSFATFETSPKSGGFIDGRFMTGIQPQDFFFHCMAGREGLIDTAVKTSRSGYLQRCLIKHLEGLSVHYDLTVRDSDNSVIQFLYGEDGLDILKARFLNANSLKFLEDNSKVILRDELIKQMRNDDDLEKIHKYSKKLKSWQKKHGKLLQKRRSSSFKQFSSELRDEIEVSKPKKLNKKTGRLRIDEKIITLWTKADVEDKLKYEKKTLKCPDPVISKYNADNVYGAVSEYLESLIQSYTAKNAYRQTDIKDILYMKSLSSQACPGEPVGLLAAQSIGEPSTQMTLNTFHFAGRGEMNVTLGIPRLREILMLASENIKTPSMDIPFRPNQTKHAEKLRIKLNQVSLADVLETVNVKTCLVLNPKRCHQYTLHFKILPKDAYDQDFCVKPKQIIKYLSSTFFKLFFRALNRTAQKNNYSKIELDDGKSKEDHKDENNDDDDVDILINDKLKKTIAVDDSSDEEDNNDNDASEIKLKSRKVDEQDYDEPEEEEELLDANYNDDDIDNDDLDRSDVENSEDEDDLTAIKENKMVNDFQFDSENYLWCTLTFVLPLKFRRPDISVILKELAKKAFIYQVPCIKRAITYIKDDQVLLKTDGINIVEMFKYSKLLDLNKLYSNDIHGIAKTYGIEAASRVIVKEIQNVFKVYGITVDPRHLLLVADYMTSEGTFKPLSRKGLEFSPSPLQQMSFESCMQFLKAATVAGRGDELNSPSSCLMVGLPVKTGTGCFSVMSKIC